MRSFLGIVGFVLLGLLTAGIISFSNLVFSPPLPYDYEQKALGNEIIIKFSYVVAENTPKGLAAQKFARLVDKLSKGRVLVELFPDGSLYNEFDELGALQQGNVQMIAPDFSVVSGLIPQWAVMDLPFAFANDDAVNAALNGDIGQELLKTLRAQNMIGLAFWDNGFRQMTNDVRPLVNPSDMSGLNFRIEPSDVMKAECQLLNATTTTLPFNQLYHKLEIHAVDGEENSISNIESQKLYQVQRYITINNISYLGYVVLIDKKFWDNIPPNLQSDIQLAMRETTTWENRAANQLNQQQWLELAGHTSIQVYTLTAAEKAAWLQTLHPVYDQFSDVFGQRLMDDIAAIQHKYGP